MPIKPDENGFFEVTLGHFDAKPNSSGVHYPPEVIGAAVSKLNERITKGKLIVGELGRPTRHIAETHEQFKSRYLTIDESKAAFSVMSTSTVTDENGGVTLFGKIKLWKTPYGKIVEQFMAEIPKVSFGARAYYDPKLENPLTLITFDVVTGHPSISVP